ncbi:transposable element Tc3 transposase [Trichonephila clavipes]|nr:transposable element Tc3 transposase [Trichonephila clavipes]
MRSFLNDECRTTEFFSHVRTLPECHVWDVMDQFLEHPDLPIYRTTITFHGTSDKYCFSVILLDSDEDLVARISETAAREREIPGIFERLPRIYSQFGLAIHQNDHQERRRFVEWAQNEIAVVPDFHKRIWFSDEAHFWLNGYVNKQKLPHLSEATNKCMKHRCASRKLTVWCALWAAESFKTMKAANVTVNGDRYRAMITNFDPELNNHEQTRSCYAKSLSMDKPQTLDHLEDNIRRVIADIRPQMLEKSHRKLTSRLTTSESPDKSKCTQQSDSRRVITSRENGANFHHSRVTKIDRFGYKGILVCDSIMLGSLTPLHAFDTGTVNS